MDGCAVVIAIQACIVYQYVRIDVRDRCRCVVVQARAEKHILPKKGVVLCQPFDVRHCVAYADVQMLGTTHITKEVWTVS